MEPGALRPYEDALQQGAPLHLLSADGGITVLDVARWVAPADAVDHAVLDGCAGPVLDIGCGPGRLVSALHARGTTVLGIDIAAVAVSMARDRSAPALCLDVFGPVPLAGSWRTALLLDGNIGIGGDPGRLLARVRDVLGPAGQAVVETDPDEGADARDTVRFAQDGVPTGPAFGWAQVGLSALAAHAQSADLRVCGVRRLGGRTFATLSSAAAR